MAQIVVEFTPLGEEELLKALKEVEQATGGVATAVDDLGNESKSASKSVANMGDKAQKTGGRLDKMQALAIISGVSLKDLAKGALGAAKAMVKFAGDGAQSIDTSARFSVVAEKMSIDMDRLRSSVGGGAVDDTTLQQIALFGANLGVSGKELEDLGKVATAFSRGTGADLQETFRTMVTAVGQGETGALKPFAKGIGDIGDIALRAGVDLKSLTAEQRSALIVTELNSKSVDLLAQNSLPSMAESHQRAGAQVDNFISGLQEMAAQFVDDTDLLGIFSSLMDGLSPIIDVVSMVLSAMAPILKVVGAVLEIVIKGLLEYQGLIGFTVSALKPLNIASSEAAKEIRKLTAASKAASEAQSALAVSIADVGLALSDQAFEAQLQSTLELIRESEKLNGESLATQQRAVALAEQEIRAERKKVEVKRFFVKESRDFNDALMDEKTAIRALKDEDLAGFLIGVTGSSEEAHAELGKMIEELENLSAITGTQFNLDFLAGISRDISRGFSSGVKSSSKASGVGSSAFWDEIIREPDSAQGSSTASRSWATTCATRSRVSSTD